MRIENYSMTIEAIDTAMDGIEEMAARLRELSDAGSKMGDDLTSRMDGMTREDRFEAAMQLWRQFSKIGTALTWLELHTRTARRNANTLLNELPEEA